MRPSWETSDRRIRRTKTQRKRKREKGKGEVETKEAIGVFCQKLDVPFLLPVNDSPDILVFLSLFFVSCFFFVLPPYPLSSLGFKNSPSTKRRAPMKRPCHQGGVWFIFFFSIYFYLPIVIII